MQVHSLLWWLPNIQTTSLPRRGCLCCTGILLAVHCTSTPDEFAWIRAHQNANQARVVTCVPSEIPPKKGK
eukprot:4159909-Amphidinium_carterae.1